MFHAILRLVTLNRDKSSKIGHRNRLRLRFLKSGLAGFSDYEIVELLLSFLIPRKDVKPLAKDMIIHFGCLKNIFDARMDELMAIDGIGEYAAVGIKFMHAIHGMYVQGVAEELPIFDNVDSMSTLWKTRIGGLTKEVFEIAYLGSDLRILRDGIERMESGTAVRTTIYPRKIAEAALKRNASAIVIAHNHPNGNAMPSDSDERITRTIKIALQYLDIRLIDHIIISATDCFSFAQAGLL